MPYVHVCSFNNTSCCCSFYCYVLLPLLVQGWGPLKTLFYSVQVMTTVGWGETSPVTVTGKVLTVFYILEGLTLLVSLLGTVFEYAMEKAHRAGETTKGKLQNLTEATLGNDAVDTPRVYANAVTEFVKCNWLKLSPRVRAFVSSHASYTTCACSSTQRSAAVTLSVLAVVQSATV
jgi:Ion channel